MTVRNVIVPGGGGVAGGAPTDAEYVVAAANAGLSAERVLTDTASVTWDFATPGQAKATAVAGGAPPTGTGFRHVTAGVEDAAAKLVDTADVNNNQVTYAKIQDVSATDRVLGRSTAGAGDVEEIPCTAAGRALLDDATAGDQRTTLGLGALATKSTVATGDIDNGAVTYAKMQDVSATDRFLGRKTAGAGDPEELTGTEATARLDVVTSALKGLAPASGGGTTNFLRADATWALPPSASGASLTRIAGNSGAIGADITWLRLTADSALVTVVSPGTTVITLTGVGAGDYLLRATLLYHCAVAASGIGFGINHTGTVTRFVANWRFVSTGGGAATGVADSVAATVAGQLVEGKSGRTLNSIIGSTSAGVDTINTDIMADVLVTLTVTVSGNLEIKIMTETAGDGVLLKAPSFVELMKFS